jgi:hypothetical protein
MMTAKIIGEKKVVERIKGFLPSMRNELKTYVEKFRINTVYYIQSQKLSGQVLHHRKGTLKESIARQSKVEEIGENLSVKIGTNLEYAPPLEYGSKPHVILPKNKLALAFRAPWGPGQGKEGLSVFAKVNHPGFPAKSFLRTTLNEKKEEWRQGLSGVVSKVISK